MPRRKEWYQVQEIDWSKFTTILMGGAQRQAALPKPISVIGAKNIAVKQGGSYKYVSGVFVAKEVPLSLYTIYIHDAEGYMIENQPSPPVRIGVIMGDKNLPDRQIKYKQRPGMYDPGTLGYFGYGTVDNPHAEDDEANGKYYTSWWEVQAPTQFETPRCEAHLIVRNCEFPIFIGIQTNTQSGTGNVASAITLRSLKTAGKQFACNGQRYTSHGRVATQDTLTQFKCYFQLYRKNSRSSEVDVASFLTGHNNELFDYAYETFTI